MYMCVFLRVCACLHACVNLKCHVHCNQAKYMYIYTSILALTVSGYSSPGGVLASTNINQPQVSE